LLSIAAVAAVSLSAGRAAAQYPAPYPVQQACCTQGSGAPKGCDTASCGTPGCASVGGGCLSGLGQGGCLKGGCLQGGCGDTRFGWCPIFQKWGMGGCASGGCSHGLFGGKFHGGLLGHGGFGGVGGSGQTLPGVDPRNAGQLAFPQNPFTRGPRDYFMWDE